MARPPLRKIDKYAELEVIGEGGFGVVYKARDPVLGRMVAIKVLDLDLAQGFTLEIETLRKLMRVHHPHIATIYDVHQSQDLLYIVTEYLSGRTLAEILEAEGPMPLKRALPILEQAANALDYAHSLGVIHRDIKPSNIIVEEDQKGKVRITLMDFDLVKSIKVERKTTGRYATDIIAGTLAYMAPEQLTGEHLSPATDIYAFGTVAYEMLTGHIPFEGKGTVEMLYAIPHESPPNPKSILESIPASVGHVLLKALSKASEERYPTAMALVEALREAQYGKGPVVHTPARRIDELIAALRNRDNSVRQVAAEALGKLRDIQAVEPLATALRDEDAYVRRAAVEALGKIGDARAIEPLIRALRDNNIYTRRAAAKALGEIGDVQAVEPLIAALRDDKVSVRRAAAETLGKIGDVRAVGPLIASGVYETADIALESFRAFREVDEVRLDQLIESLVPANEEWQVRVLSRVGQALAQVGEQAKAREVLTRALAAAEGIEVDRRKVEVLGEIAHALAKIGERIQARDVLVQALASIEAIDVESRRAIMLSEIVPILARIGDRVSMVRALTIARAIEDRRRRAEALREVAQALEDLGQTMSIAHAHELLQAEEAQLAIGRGVAQAVGEGSLVLAGNVQASDIITGYVHHELASSVETFAVAQIEGHNEGTVLVVNREQFLLLIRNTSFWLVS